MKTDINGCSTTKKGTEQYELFGKAGHLKIQYDYRTPDGKLFTCIANGLTEARQKRDAWLAKQ